ncbi:MAG: RNase H family protein [Candidatus Acidiferrales bacterium]
MYDLRSLKIYVDGACPRNVGGPGGWCAWLEHPFGSGLPDEFLESRGYFRTTNNRMELRGCLFAHEWILDRSESIKAQHVQIFSDSQYVCESYACSLWWSTNDWCNSAGRQMLNVDLWKELLRTRRKIRGRPRVELIQIPRRSCPLAVKVDDGAKSAARSPQYNDVGFMPGKIGRSRNNVRKAARLYPAAGDEVIIFVYKSGVLRRGVQTIRFQAYCGERRDFFDKFWAMADEIIGNSLHRGNFYRVRMNDEAANPRILAILARLEKSEVIGQPIPVATE